MKLNHIAAGFNKFQKLRLSPFISFHLLVAATAMASMRVESYYCSQLPRTLRKFFDKD